MNDEQILNLLQKSDRDAYKQLFLKYYSPLCEYASHYISDADSEELVQDLMLFIWETRKMLIIGTSLKSYLFISTKHRCLNAIKKQLYHERIHNHIYEKIKDQFEDPDYYFVNELTEHINKAIRELPDTYRDTFTLSRFGELTNTQIATKLGVSVKTVEYRISQALKILRVRLKDYLPLLSFLFGFPSWKREKRFDKRSQNTTILRQYVTLIDFIITREFFKSYLLQDLFLQ